MQHIVHLFVGEELIGLRDRFASLFHELHPEIAPCFFAALSMVKGDDGKININADDTGLSTDSTVVDADNFSVGIANHFSQMYNQRVNVVHPGNQSMVIMVWSRLFDPDQAAVIKELVDAVHNGITNRSINIEVCGFTDDAVSFFIPQIADRLPVSVYKADFLNNLNGLRQIRQDLSACRLIANVNVNQLALNLDLEALARVCAEFAALMNAHYLTVHQTVPTPTTPFETFGLSSVVFDEKYFVDYIRNCTVLDVMRRQGIANRRFLINQLAQRTDPIVKDILKQIKEFYRTTVANAKASLTVQTGGALPSHIAAKVDTDLKAIVANLRDRIDSLRNDGAINVFEYEALLTLILGDDCAMFDTGAISANEMIINDIIDEGNDFFVGLDSTHEILEDVTLEPVKKVRERMRNIAIANRQRRERISRLQTNISEAVKIQQHIENGGFRFGNTNYRVDLQIDTEPLEDTYKPHSVSQKSIDLRNIFGPIRDQGQQGSCASFAISSVVEALRRNGKRLSPAYLYWHARNAQGESSTDNGASLYGVLKTGQDKGVCPEELMPYDASVFDVAPSADADSAAADCRVIEAKNVDVDIDAIKSAISDGLPVVIAARIFNSFSDTIHGFVRHPSNEEISQGDRDDGHGSHAMVICGYSDEDRVFVVRNSWGNQFGDSGYCYMPYSYAKQYVKQACVVTQVSPADDAKDNAGTKKTLNFDINDQNIEAAILLNLIAEDNYELDVLTGISNDMKAQWTRNIGKLGNTNTQNDLLQKALEACDAEIESIKKELDTCQDTKSDKLKQWWKDRIISIGCWGAATLLGWTAWWFAPNWILLLIASVITLIFIIVISNVGYQFRVYRQSLLDEINDLANQISSLEERKKRLTLESHIYGSIIRDFVKYKDELHAEAQRLHAFNEDFVSLHNELSKKISGMTPTVPYPFLSVLSNNQLDQYFQQWRDPLARGLNIQTIAGQYKIGDKLEKLIEGDTTLDTRVRKGLAGFSMRNFIVPSGQNPYLFMPTTQNIDHILQALDQRSVPFCQYGYQQMGYAKYLFITDANILTQSEIQVINRNFSQAPQRITVNDKNSVRILTISNFNI